MLTPLDDYPIHQTAEPAGQPCDGNANFFDRYFFNGFTRDGTAYFAMAFGLYPNRRIADGAFSVVVDNQEHSVWATDHLPLDRLGPHAGPLSIEIVEPLRAIRLHVDAPDQGIQASLTFHARTEALEEARSRSTGEGGITADFTRMVQWGAWEGSIHAHGEDIQVRPDSWLGVRDRSWGIRPLGRQLQASPERPYHAIWVPIHFDDHCMHVVLRDDPEGRHRAVVGLRIPTVAGHEDAAGGSGVRRYESVDAEVSWTPGTRWATRARLLLADGSGAPEEIRLEPLLRFQMFGVGYQNAEWAHGLEHGEPRVESATWDLSEVDPQRPESVHVQHVCRATSGGEIGTGILEHVVLGAHRPSGFVDFVGGARSAEA